MTNRSRVNIYELLKDEFTSFNSVLDVGCCGLNDLVDFEFSPFKQLIGVDRVFGTNPFGDYFRLFKDDPSWTEEQKRAFRMKKFNEFQNRFTIYTMDFRDYNFIENPISLIICNKVLHFYNPEEKLELIRIFYNALEKDGILFIKINHNLHANNTDLSLVNKIAENTFQTKEKPEDIRYLVDSAAFIDALCSYRIIEKFIDIDDKTITIVIRK
jgi:SAM-dependent methyltransferase